MFVVFCEVYLVGCCLLLVVGGLCFDECVVEWFGVDCVFGKGMIFVEVVFYFVYVLLLFMNLLLEKRFV